VWWCTSVIPAFRRWSHADHKFKTSLGYTEKPCLKITKKKLKIQVFIMLANSVGKKFGYNN
jgi:hypothetical protein